MTTHQIQPKARGIDAITMVPVHVLVALGWCEFVGMYFKNMIEAYWRALVDAGIAPLFTSEHGELDAQNGAALGAQHARQALADAAKYRIPAGSIIILTNDTPLNADGSYMAAASPIIRDGGFQFGTYGGTKAVDDSLEHGAVLDFIHAPGARSWGTHPLSTVQQHAQDTTTIPGYTVDRNDCLRSFWPFGAPPAPPVIEIPPAQPPIVVIPPGSSTVPQPPTTNVQEDTVIVIVESPKNAAGEYTDYTAQFIADAQVKPDGTLAIFRLTWIDGRPLPDGSANPALAAMAAHEANGVQRHAYGRAQYFSSFWVDRLPVDDALHTWVRTDVADVTTEAG